MRSLACEFMGLISAHSAYSRPRHLVQIPLVGRYAPRCGLNHSPLRYQIDHLCLAVSPMAHNTHEFVLRMPARPRSRRGQVVQPKAPAGFRLHVAVMAFDVGRGVWGKRLAKNSARALEIRRVIQQHLAHARPVESTLPIVTFRRRSPPTQFVQKIAPPENRIQHAASGSGSSSDRSVGRCCPWA